MASPLRRFFHQSYFDSFLKVLPPYRAKNLTQPFPGWPIKIWNCYTFLNAFSMSLIFFRALYELFKPFSSILRNLGILRKNVFCVFLIANYTFKDSYFHHVPAYTIRICNIYNLLIKYFTFAFTQTMRFTQRCILMSLHVFVINHFFNCLKHI